MRESTIQAAIRKAICRDGRAIVTRNNTGRLRSTDQLVSTLIHLGLRPFHPDPIALVKRALLICRLVAFGLGVGSPDLVGIIVEGPHRGRVFCLEVKQPGKKPTPKQAAWARACRARGGFCATVHSVDEAMAALERALAGGSQ